MSFLYIIKLVQQSTMYSTVQRGIYNLTVKTFLNFSCLSYTHKIICFISGPLRFDAPSRVLRKFNSPPTILECLVKNSNMAGTVLTVCIVEVAFFED